MGYIREIYLLEKITIRAEGEIKWAQYYLNYQGGNNEDKPK